MRNNAVNRQAARAASAAAGNGKYPLSRMFATVAEVTAREVGRAWVFALAIGVIIVWAISGPFFDLSDTWQLVVNTGTTIVTFLMVFLIQNAQNRDGAAIQVKLNELIRVSRAQNSFVGIEHMTEEELDDIRAKCEARAKAADAQRPQSKRATGNQVSGGQKGGAKGEAH
jgi:low affinity Fe/Cu permease